MDWDDLRQKYAPLVWSTVARILKDSNDSLDCCQDVFIEAFERMQKQPIQNHAAWLRWLATRRAIDALRKRNRRITPDGFVETEIARLDPPEQALEQEELLDRIRAEVGRLPTKQAEAFWLVCVEQREHDEIAELLDITSNSLAVLIHRARKTLQKRLEQDYLETKDRRTS